jgi:hypothetical protein
MLSTDHADPLLFHSQMEEHAKMLHISPIDVYWSAVRIWSELEDATVGLAQVHVALPHEFNAKSLSKADRRMYLKQMQEYRKIAREHPLAQQDDEEVQDALAAQGVPRKPAIIALYSAIQYNASPFYQQALKHRKAGDEQVTRFQAWLSANRARDCEPTLDNYLDWLSATLDLKTMESRRFRLVFEDEDQFISRYTYGNFVRIDRYVPQLAQSIKPVPAPIYPTGPS